MSSASYISKFVRMYVTCYFYARLLKIHSQVTTSEAIDDFYERVRASIVRGSCLDVLIALIRVY